MDLMLFKLKQWLVVYEDTFVPITDMLTFTYVSA